MLTYDRFLFSIKRREYLEIGPVSNDLDFSRIFENMPQSKPAEPVVHKKVTEKIPPPDFQDDDEVPPLE